jgi:hypothetical protein
MQNLWGKHYTAFVKVVGGSYIYNFPIHHFVHLYSSFGRKTCSKWLSLKSATPGPGRAATSRRPARRARRASGRRRLGVRSRQRTFPRLPRTFPRPRASQCASKSSRPAPHPTDRSVRGFRPDARLPRSRPYYGEPVTLCALRNMRQLPYLRPLCFPCARTPHTVPTLAAGAP